MNTDMIMMDEFKALYSLEDCTCTPVEGHEGGRNRVYVCSRNGRKEYVLRVSDLGDRTEEDYLAETEFVHYLARNGAPVADVIPSARGRLVEYTEEEGKPVYISLFEYAKGILLCDNGYRYREGVPLEEYFYNTGKTLGAIHRLSKAYRPEHKRGDYFDKYNREYIDSLIPDSCAELKQAVFRRLDAFRKLSVNTDDYGLVHFDFCDGNYHIDMDTGRITVFDFDNCVYCWYMFDLAHLWTHGVGWCRMEQDPVKRMAYMKHYFDTILEGYRSETEVSGEMLEQLQLFIDMTEIEFLVDEFECCAREGEEPDEEDIGWAAQCLIRDIPWVGMGIG